MSALGFLHRLRNIMVPTLGQTLGALFLSLFVLTAAQFESVVSFIGLNPTAYNAGEAELHARFSLMLQSPVASNIALVTFWATVGIVAYLICWGVYNLYIEARNEVTLAADYTNRTDPVPKHWRGPLETLAVKATAAVALALIMSSLWYGISFWIALSDQFLREPSLDTGITAVAAVLGFAIHLYLAFLFVLLTFTPWYRDTAQPA